MDVETTNQTQLSALPLGDSNHSIRTIWHKSAPEAVRKAYRSGKLREGWSAWTEHLRRRQRPLALSDLLPSRRSPLLWLLPDEIARGGPPDVLRQIVQFGSAKQQTGAAGREHRAPTEGWSGRSGGLGRSPFPSQPEKAALEWLGGAAGTVPGAGYALEALAWAWALAGIAGALGPEPWWSLLDHLLGAVADAGEIDQEEEPLVHQLVAGELPLTLAHLFPEIRACRRLARQARRALSAGLTGLLDGQGLPHARHLRHLRPLLACWTRCRALADELPKGCWTEAAQTQYEWLVRHALRLTRADGAHVFSRGSAGTWSRELFEAALRFGGDEDDRQIAALVLPERKRPTQNRLDPVALPEPANHSEWAALGMLRTGWSIGDPRLTVAYPGRSVRIELEAGQEVLWSGTWELEVVCDGRLAPPVSSWEDVCWVSDDDMDYLELEIRLGGGLRVQRHALLAREDRFLFLADAVLTDRATSVEQPAGQPWCRRPSPDAAALTDRPTSLEYRGCLPLGEGISFEAAADSTEGFLVGQPGGVKSAAKSRSLTRNSPPRDEGHEGKTSSRSPYLAGEKHPSPRLDRKTPKGGKRRALVLPLALPEWRADRRVGSLVGTERGLELHQRGVGRATFAPLFFDLQPRRMTRPFTWRQLTVAEGLEIQPLDVAVGYRVRIGRAQWLIYRALGQVGNRTLLGHNLVSEMLVARFDRDGEVETLLEIEPG